MKRLCVILALALVSTVVVAKSWSERDARAPNAYGDEYYDMGPEANYRYHCWYVPLEGVEQGMRRCRPEDIAEPKPRKRTAADYLNSRSVSCIF